MKTVLASNILSIFFLFVNGDSETTLTTAIECDSECLKPRALYRRIFVDHSIEDGRSTALNFFRAKDLKHRRSHGERIKKKRESEIWKWDYWCQLQPKMGSCSKKLEKFYYDAQLDQCVTFTYRGCNGNKNNFDTLVDCERHCKGATFMEFKDVEPTSLCSLQPSAGLCLAIFTKYYYDVNGGTCKKFIYGGCGGNGNRFRNEHECLKRCGKSENVGVDQAV